MAPASKIMNAIGIKPRLAVKTSSTSRLIKPAAMGRSEREIPSKMLKVASVAIIAGSFTQRTRRALKSPIRTPAPRIAKPPKKTALGGALSVTIKEAMITPMVMIEPTETSRYPTSIAFICAMVTSARGSVANNKLRKLNSDRKAVECEAVYLPTIRIKII